MLFKRFNFKVILRIGLLMITLCTFAFIFGNKALLFNQIILASIIIAQVYDLTKFVSKTNYELSKFLLAVTYSDYSGNYNSGGLGASFESLHQSFFKVMDTIKEAKIQKEAQHQFLEMLIDKISVGIISIKENDEIYLINKEARALLDIENLRHWQDLDLPQRGLRAEIEKIGEYGKKLITLKSGKQLSVGVSAMLLINRQYRLILIQDIEPEMEQKEMEAWNKLIRILTHEIMNSVLPITSLTDSLLRLLEDGDGKQRTVDTLHNDDINDIRLSLKTIQRRSDGMLKFVEDYRKLSKIPTPAPEEIEIKALLESIYILMKGEVDKKGITLLLHPPASDQTILADPQLIEQVLINVITNSIHALENKPGGTIEINTSGSRHQKIITIKDNGGGIDAKKLESIFVPFYSTKTNGSGIGLSLSKQIMNLHNGTIKVISSKGVGASFMLVFNG